MSLHDRLDPRRFELPAAWTEKLMSPALIVYLDHVRENVAAAVARLGGDVGRWRPHVKTTKIPEVFAELARAGVRHFKCATTREAWHLGDVLRREGIADGDVLLAYPLLGPGLARLGDVAAELPGTRYSVLCEDARLAASIPRNVDVFVDVNPGMNRTGVPMEDAATILAVALSAGARFRGLHFYDGHVHGHAGHERRALVFAGYERLLDLRAALAEAGAPVRELVTAGTPAFPAACDFAPFRALAGCVHRVSPGTVVYHDARSEEENPDLPLTPAALVLARVVSHPTGGIVTCDAGSKSLAAEAGAPCAVVLGHPELEALAPNEEHLPLRVLAGELPPRGTELLLVPRHVCPTVNLAEEAVLVEGGEVRGVVPVAARAHEIVSRAGASAAG